MIHTHIYIYIERYIYICIHELTVYWEDTIVNRCQSSKPVAMCHPHHATWLASPAELARRTCNVCHCLTLSRLRLVSAAMPSEKTIYIYIYIHINITYIHIIIVIVIIIITIIIIYTNHIYIIFTCYNI